MVRESQGGTSDVAFSYRLAVRRTDIENGRFKSVELIAAIETFIDGWNDAAILYLDQDRR